MNLARRLGWCSSLLLLGVGTQAGAQSIGPGSRFHRQSVDGPTSNGWVRANSTEGRYSLEIPCAYNDVTATPENGPSTGNDHAFVVACDRQDGVRFYAMRIQYPGGRAAAQALFDRRFSGLPLAAAAHVSGGQMSGRDYLDLDLDQPGRCLFARIVRAGDENLMTLVEPVNAPNMRCAALRPDAERFRRSITVRD